MREIRFRAYHKKWKKMLLVKSISWIHGGGVHLGDFGSKEVYQLEPMKDVVLMQYTGLKDKNGKEIYEGDRVREDSPPHHCGEIKYDGGAFYNSGITSGYSELCHFLVDEFWEIIGNVHENPGLLDK